MIVRSTGNNLNPTCDVCVEWREDDSPSERQITAFAVGAAAAHNKGHDAWLAEVIEWTSDGFVLPPPLDTSNANGARVRVRIEP